MKLRRDDLRHSSEDLRRKVRKRVSQSVGRLLGRSFRSAARLKGTRTRTQLLTFCSFTRDSRTNANKQKVLHKLVFICSATILMKNIIISSWHYIDSDYSLSLPLFNVRHNDSPTYNFKNSCAIFSLEQAVKKLFYFALFVLLSPVKREEITT